MQITVMRAAQQIPGTSWSPAEHSMQQRQRMEWVHRAIPTDEADVTRSRVVETDLEALDLLLAGSRDYTEARIEDPYELGTFVEGFYYVRALAAFVHKDKIKEIEKMPMPERIGPGAIISKAVRIGEGTVVGAFAELERGARLDDGVSVGADTVIRKGSILKEGASVGAHSYIGQFSQVGKGAKIGSMSLVERETRVHDKAEIGRQNHVGEATHIGTEAFLDDSVSVGRYGYIGNDASVGEMVTIGNSSHIGDRSMIGAESELGDLVRVAKDVMLLSPTYADDGAVFLRSNFLPIFPNKM